MLNFRRFGEFWITSWLKGLFIRLVACMWPDRQQGTAPALLQLQEHPAAIQDLPMLQPASQTLTRQALEIVLQHHCSAAHQQNLCTMLQVSKEWKAALLQAAAGQIDISLLYIQRGNQLSKITSLAPWLRKYGACVSSLKITSYHSRTKDPDELSSRLELQLKAVSQIAAAVEGGVLDHNTGSLVPWSSLRTLDINLPVDGGLLAVLPTGLTEMTLTTKASSTDFAALGRLQNLRSLELISESYGSRVPQSCLQELSSLTLLASLTMRNPATDIDWTQVPRNVRYLNVQDMDLRQPTGGMQLHLGHVDGLTSIGLTCDGVHSGSQLPASLRDLHVICTTDMPVDMILVPLGVSGLTALTSIGLKNVTGACEALGLLGQLTQLQKVDIGWDGEPLELIHVASALCNVPGDLSLQASIRSPTGTTLDDSTSRHMQQLGALTQLTKLLLSVLEAQGALGAAAVEPLALCKHLSSIASLQILTVMARTPFVKHDVQHLTALRSLTSLALFPSSPNADYLSLPLPFRSCF